MMVTWIEINWVYGDFDELHNIPKGENLVKGNWDSHSRIYSIFRRQPEFVETEFLT